MKVDLMVVYSIILGAASLITAFKVIGDIIKKPSQKFKKIDNLEKRVEKLEMDNSKIEDVIKKIDNLIVLQYNQNCSIKSSLEERKLLIRSNKALIKAVSSLLKNANMDSRIKQELTDAETELDNFIIGESHKNSLDDDFKGNR